MCFMSLDARFDIIMSTVKCSDIKWTKSCIGGMLIGSDCNHRGVKYMTENAVKIMFYEVTWCKYIGTESPSCILYLSACCYWN